MWFAGAAVVLSINGTGHCTVASIGPFASGGQINVTKVLGEWDRELDIERGATVAVRLL